MQVDFKKMSELDEIEDLLKKGEKEKAFELIKDKDTNSLAEGLIERVSSLIEHEKYDFAITYFEFSEKIAIDNDIKEIARKHLADAYLNRGLAYVEKGEFDRAIEDFDKAIGLNPEYADAYFNRGTAHSTLNQHEKAIENYNKAIELDPNLALAYSNRGLAYYSLNKHDEAIADYNEAIELDPNFALAYYNRGLAYYSLNKHDEAIADWNKAIELDPNLALAYNNRGAAYDSLKKYDEAIADYNEAIKLDPNLAMAYNNRGLTYYGLNRYDEAIADYNKAIELNPDFVIAHANLGNSLFMTEDYDNAEKGYREAIKINKDIDYAHNGLGLVLSKREAYKNAIAEFKKALKLSKDTDFYNNLGCAYAEYGKGSAIAPFRIFNAKNKLRKATQENTYIEAHKNLTRVGDLLNYELKIFFLRIFIIFFIFALSINLFEPITINRLILILTGVATLGMVLFSLDFTKIEIKSLKVAGVEAEFNYEKPKAGEKAVQFAPPK